MTFKAIGTNVQPHESSFPALLLGGTPNGRIVATIDDNGDTVYSDDARSLPHFAESDELLKSPGDFLWYVFEGEHLQIGGSVRWGRQEDFVEV